jgi:hypothetical protein
MKIRSILLSLCTGTLLLSLGSVAAFAEEAEVLDESEIQEETVVESEEDVNCSVSYVEDATFDASLVAFRRALSVEPDEEFRLKVFVKNSGNTSWFSNSSGCKWNHAVLKTDNPFDEPSEFWAEGLEGWENESTISLDQDRVDPGEIASFTAYLKAGEDEDVYKHYFVPVIEDSTRMDNAQFSFDTIVGESDYSASEIRQMMMYSLGTGSVTDIDLNATKLVMVDRASQEMTLMLGDTILKQFPISTGLAGTVTPLGVAKVTCKQEVRIGHKSPYYIMPNFHCLSYAHNGYGFVGYGLHASPSLGSSSLRAKIRSYQAQGIPVPPSLYEDDVLWTQAVASIGNPASHGCVRILHDDSDWLTAFSDLDTWVIVDQYIEDHAALAKQKLPELF